MPYKYTEMYKYIKIEITLVTSTNAAAAQPSLLLMRNQSKWMV